MSSYTAFTSPATFQKFINELDGILKGIKFDNLINDKEIHFLSDFYNKYEAYQHFYPFKEVIPVLLKIDRAKRISEEDYLDLVYLVERLKPENGYYDLVTSKMQELHGILTGILADGLVNDSEIHSLSSWIDDNLELNGLWPFDEIETLLHQILKDGTITEEERSYFESYLYNFVILDDNKTILQTEPIKQVKLKALCSMNVDISFDGKIFAATGEFYSFEKKVVERKIIERGGVYRGNISNKTDYLIIGSKGNPAWAFSTYGRKIEEAMNIRKTGAKVQMIHEADFIDALGE